MLLFYAQFKEIEKIPNVLASTLRNQREKTLEKSYRGLKAQDHNISMKFCAFVNCGEVAENTAPAVAAFLRVRPPQMRIRVQYYSQGLTIGDSLPDQTWGESETLMTSIAAEMLFSNYRKTAAPFQNFRQRVASNMDQRSFYIYKMVCVKAEGAFPRSGKTSIPLDVNCGKVVLEIKISFSELINALLMEDMISLSCARIFKFLKS